MHKSGLIICCSVMLCIKSVLYYSLLICILCILLIKDCETRSVSSVKKGGLKGYQFVKEYVNDNDDEDECFRLPPLILTEILGAAYNSRYMSIEAPNIIEDESTTTKQELGVGKSGNGKRKVTNFPPFYVDDNYALELSNKPAWEVQHAIEDVTPHQLRDKREVTDEDINLDSLNTNTRTVRATHGNNMGRRSGTSEKAMSNVRPWECEARIKWLDLGPDYFPRFLRTIECTKHFCWYGHYTCQPRSFTVKILRRRTGECVRSDRLRRIGVEGLPGDLRELWVWEERAVNFCCDCAAP